MIDIELIKKADKATWDKLVEDYNQMLFNIAFNVLNNKELALDISQDALYTALKNISHFEGNTFSEFIQWLKKITFRLAINKYNWKKKHKTRSLDEVLKQDDENNEEETTLGDTIPGGIETPLDQADNNERLRAVHQIVEELPPDGKMLYELHYVKGIKYEEIAQRLRKPVNTIKVQFFRLHDTIRKKLNKPLASNAKR